MHNEENSSWFSPVHVHLEQVYQQSSDHANILYALETSVSNMIQ